MKSKRRATAYSPIRQMSNSRDRAAASLDEPYQRGRVNGTNTWRQQPIESSTGLENSDPTLTSIQRPASVTNIDPEDNVEEVYLCDCCGVTKELSPAMKYMPIFRSLFFLFNFLAFAFGFADFGMGLWFRIDPKVYEIHKYIETQNFTIAGWILLFGGFTGCLLTLLGCVAAFRQTTSTLLVYCIVMTLLTLGFVGTLVLLTIYGFGTSLELFLTKEIYEQIRRRSMSTELDLFANNDAAQFLDFVQVKMRCCGATDFRDYGKLGMVVPTTCYTIAKNFLNAPGCGRAIRELFDIRAGMAAGCTAGSVISQLLSVIFASLMICSIYNWRANLKNTPVTSTRNPTTPQGSPTRRFYSPGLEISI